MNGYVGLVMSGLFWILNWIQLDSDMLHMMPLPFEIPVRVDDALLMALSTANPGLKMERNTKGNLVVMSPSGSRVSEIQFEIARQVGNWNKKTKLGHAFDAQGGFRLPDGSILSPDCAWVSSEQWRRLTTDEQRTFAPVCPDFVVEVISPSDSLEQQREKMEHWIHYGVRLGWLIDPDREHVVVYRPEKAPLSLFGFDRFLNGETVLPGFELDLRELRDD